MRRYKTPEQLKEWRERHAALSAKLQADRAEHEDAMQRWADANCRGEMIVCPDGVVRRPTRLAMPSYWARAFKE